VPENKEFGEGEKCDKYILSDDKEIFIYNVSLIEI
jgi:hypothetical protein